MLYIILGVANYYCLPSNTLIQFIQLINIIIDNYCFSSGPLPCTLNLGVANPAFLDGGGGFGGSDSDNDDDFLGLDLPQYHLLT